MPFTKITAAGIDTTGTLITQQLSVTGISTVGSLSIGNTSVISSARQLQNIVSLDATTIATVESAIANAPNTFTDLSVSGISTLGSATASSLVVSGVSTVSAGTSALPSITPSGDSNTGIFFPAADTISASTSGTARITIDSSGNITVTNNLIIPLGTVLLPSLAFLSDPNTGLFSPGADQLAISTNGTSRIVVDASGNVNIDSGTFYVDAANNRVGFGTASPSCQLNTVSSSTGELVRFSSSAGSGEINLSVGYTTTNQAKLGYDLGTGDAIISSAGVGTAGILFKQGSTERVRIDSSGRLLVGTFSSSANATLVLNGSSGGAGNPGIAYLQRNEATPGSGSALGQIFFANNAGNTGALISSERDGGTWTSGSSHPGRLAFSTTLDGAASPTERMRITNNGRVLIGTTTDPGYQTTIVGANSYALLVRQDTGNYTYPVSTFHSTFTSGDNKLVDFFTDAASNRGSIIYNRAGGVIAYNTTSDYRAKTLMGSVEDPGKTIDALKVYRGLMNGATVDRPMLVAHEVKEVAPYCVTGKKDAVNEEGNPIYQQMDHQVLVPLLIAEIQQLRIRVAALEAA